MMRPPLSAAATGLLRSILERTNIDRSRILLTSFQSTEWHSLTFSGERHTIALRIVGEGASEVANRLLLGIGEAEWRIPGSIVADVGLDERGDDDDGSVRLRLEALTILD